MKSWRTNIEFALHKFCETEFLKAYHKTSKYNAKTLNTTTNFTIKTKVFYKIKTLTLNYRSNKIWGDICLANWQTHKMRTNSFKWGSCQGSPELNYFPSGIWWFPFPKLVLKERRSLHFPFSSTIKWISSPQSSIIYPC